MKKADCADCAQGLAEILFEKYNQALGDAFDSILDDDTLKVSEIETMELDGLVASKMSNWEQTPLEDIGGISPRQYFEGLSTLEEAMEHVNAAAVLCDDEPPMALVDKVASFGEPAVEALLKVAGDTANEGCLCVEAVKVIGRLKAAGAAGPLVQMLLIQREDELARESIVEALGFIGSPAITHLLTRIGEAGTIGDGEEYMISALSTIGRNHPSDEIYKCLKGSFLRMGNKVLGALCLGEYGDGRAIAFLRGYVEKNRETIDKVTYYQIKSSVHMLGGGMGDFGQIESRFKG